MSKEQQLQFMLNLKAELAAGKITMEEFKEKRKVILNDVKASLFGRP